MPSIEELCFMLDRPRYDEWMERAGEEDVTEIIDLEKDIRPLAAQAMELGVKYSCSNVEPEACIIRPPEQI